ncbi:MAG: hypothetical protein U0746_04640 [Gemmataceae bacterium]
MVRIRENYLGFGVDIACRNGDVRSLSPAVWSGGRQSLTGTISRSKGFFGYSDVWLTALFTHFGMNGQVYSLDELLAGPHKLRSAAEVTVDGRQLTYLDIQTGEIRNELWFDPSVNYLVRKRLVTDSSHGQSRGGAEVRGFTEVSPGLYFPSEVRLIVVGRDGHETPSTYGTSFRDIKVNLGVPDSTFSLAFPEGTRVIDGIQGREFRVGSGGKLEPDNSKQVTTTLLTSIPPAEPTPVTERGNGFASWLTPVSVAVLLVGISFALIRRRKQTP